MEFTQILYPALAIGGIGAVLGLVLGFASKVFFVAVDPKVEQISEALPQANCGACAYPGCSSYAEAVAEGKADISLCTPGGNEVIAQIAKIMGVEATSAEPQVAYVACNGTKENAKDRFEYSGIKNCSSAVFASGGHKQCDYGCLGFGECVEACAFEAMYMDEKTGLPVVIVDNCTGCGACVRACPKDVMKMKPKSATVYIDCNSKSKGKEVMDACKVGCTGCTICAMPKTTPSKKITMDNNLPIINFSVEDDLIAAQAKCPKHCFTYVGDDKAGNKAKIDAFLEEEKIKKAEMKKKAMAAKKKADELKAAKAAKEVEEAK